MGRLHRQNLSLSAVICASALLASCGDPDYAPMPGADLLIEALPDAGPGEVVALVETRYEGHFEVPAGVVLEGGGATIAGLGCAVALRVFGGSAAAPTVIRDVRIVHDGTALLAQGGHLVLEDVIIDVSAGVGLLAADLDSLTLIRVTVVGALGPGTIRALGSSMGFELDPREHPFVGLLVDRVADVQLQETTLRGFAVFGAIFLESRGGWAGGSVSEWAGTGILVEDSAIDLSGLRVGDSLRGGQLQVGPNGVAVTRGGVLTSRGLTIESTLGLGLLQDNARSEHTDLTVADNARAGIWVQNTFAEDNQPALRISGQSRIEDNLGLGLYMRNFDGLDLDGVVIEDTQIRPVLLGELSMAEFGDGVQMVGASGLVRMRDTLLSGNARAGWVFDGTGAGETTLVFDGLVLEMGGLSEDSGALGLVVQNTAVPLALPDLSRSEFEAQDARAAESGLELPVFLGVGSESVVSSIEQARDRANTAFSCP